MRTYDLPDPLRQAVLSDGRRTLVRLYDRIEVRDVFETTLVVPVRFVVLDLDRSAVVWSGLIKGSGTRSAEYERGVGPWSADFGPTPFPDPPAAGPLVREALEGFAGNLPGPG